MAANKRIPLLQEDDDDDDARAHISADGFFCPQEEKIVDEDSLAASTFLDNYFHPSLILARGRSEHSVSAGTFNNNKAPPMLEGGTPTANSESITSFSRAISAITVRHDLEVIEVNGFVSSSSLTSKRRRKRSFSFLQKRFPCNNQRELRKLHAVSLWDLYEFDSGIEENATASSCRIIY